MTKNANELEVDTRGLTGAVFLPVIVKSLHWSYIQPPTSSNDPMYTGSRCFELETDGAIVDPMVEEDT
ncbi:hypothetical protein C3447_06715 [Escherichia coli]|nr:hypothetical protein [Escherichia coli]OYE23590.1 hypothetical protein CI676_04050 [Escherichia coli]ROW77265.1 hypothetical protein C3447_06715 [Escherichia coli]